MTYLNERLVKSLKEARKQKGLSQRELSAKSGVPQSHISKIESGSVDLRVSSLIALARVLDLELALVPRKTVPAVQSIVRSNQKTVTTELKKKAHFAAYQLGETVAAVMAQSMIGQQEKKLDSFERLKQIARGGAVSHELVEQITRLTKKLEGALIDDADLRKALNETDEQMRDIVAKLPRTPPPQSVAKPAYQLGGDDD